MRQKNTEEDLSAFLRRREQQCVHRIANFQGQLRSLESELGQVHAAMAGVGLKPAGN